jgi:predicted  nucleic acid-binding Zn-ribbon protein
MAVKKAAATASKTKVKAKAASVKKAPKKATPVKKAAPKPTAKKAVAKAVVKKAVAKPISKKAAVSKSKESVKPIIKTKAVSKKTGVVKYDKTALKSKTSLGEKKSAKSMSKIDTKAPKALGKKGKNKVEEPVITKVSKPVIQRPTETRNTRSVDTDTAARLSSKYTVGDISKFQIKMPKKGIHDASIEEKLQALFQLQQIDSEIDRIRIVRGELPMEVKDLEDDVIRLETRISNIQNDITEFERLTGEKKQAIKDSNTMIKKYEGQQANVKNNREYESLNKEIEFQKLEIQLSEKRIKEYTFEVHSKKEILAESEIDLEHRRNDLENKRKELDTIVSETQKEEEILQKYSEKAGSIIEDRLLGGYKKIRDNAANGLAVVTIQRDSCGGCFNKVPPQRQLDIRQRKKVIVCEHCGRILVDSEIMTDLIEPPTK